MTRLTSFRYGNIDIREAAFLRGVPWFTRRAIGEWLGYEDPQNAVDVIINRNPHIQNPEWATPVKLTGVEGGKPVTRTIEVYSPIGLQLIIFESHQPKAVQYKIAVAKLVSDIMTGEYNRRLARTFLTATGLRMITQR